MPTARDVKKLLDFAQLYGAKIKFNINVGNIVKLKSGGPEMTVVDVDEYDVVTSIHFVGDELFETVLPKECLAVKVILI